MAKTIFDYVNSANIAAYVAENPSNNIPYLGEILFPSKKRVGLDLSWIRTKNGLPVILKPSAFDAKAELRDRAGFSKVETEMPFFREGMRIGEKERQQLNTFLAANSDPYIRTLVANIFDDIKGLVASADVNAEMMRMQLLYAGTIGITVGNVSYNYDYQFDANHKKTLAGAAMWSDTANSTPVTDIQAWQTKISDDTGTKPNRAICTTKTWGYLMANKSIRLDLDPIGGNNRIMTDSMLKTYLLEKLGVTVQVYDKKYQDASGVAKNFFPDNYFTLLPEGNMGSTWYGTTPEESDLMGGQTVADVSIVKTGVAITSVKEPHPVNVYNIVSAIILPSFENIDTVFIAKVA